MSVPTTGGAHFEWSTSGDLVGLEIVPDLTGDDQPDAVVRTRGDIWLVAGPLAASRALPMDAAATFTGFSVSDGEAFSRASDIDGDGAVDLILGDSDANAVACYGPFSNVVDVSTVPLLSFNGLAAELTGDGIWDDLVFDYDLMGHHVLPGPDRLTTNLTVDLGCRWPDYPQFYDTSYDHPSLGELVRVPDVDGDGVDELRELGLQDDFDRLPCSDFVFPSTVTGVFVPTLSAPHWVPWFLPVGDQTGDGVRDVMTEGRDILEGPVVLRTGALDGPVAFQVADVAFHAERVPFDVDGDGIGEWLLPDGAAIVTGGPSGGVVTGASWVELSLDEEPIAKRAVIEDGVAWLIVMTTGRVDVLEIGPATAVPTQ